jgi:hypothetical protein
MSAHDPATPSMDPRDGQLARNRARGTHGSMRPLTARPPLGASKFSGREHQPDAAPASDSGNLILRNR